MNKQLIKEKVISMMVAAAVLISMVSLSGTSAYAAGAAGYDAEKTLSYAEEHWNDGKGDCVAFARACVEAGGIPKESGRTYNYTAAQYKDYLISKNYAEVFVLSTDYYYADYQGIRLDDNIGKIAPGDIILYHCNNKECPRPYFHMSICSGAAKVGENNYPGWIRCYAHNKALDNKVVCKIKCSKCGAEKNSITMYAIHFKSKDNGYIYPDTPVIKSSKASSRSIKVYWKQAENADGYKIYRSTKKSSGYKLVKTVGKNITSWKNTGLSKGKRYYYKVKAYNSQNGDKLYSGYSNVVSTKL